MRKLDYNDAMLELYFRQMGFNSFQKNYLLERNPFDCRFVEWERNMKYNNRTFSVLMKKYRLVDFDSKITEVVVHEGNSAAKGFYDTFYSFCGANDKLSVDMRAGRIIVIKGLYEDEEECLRKLMYYKFPFIIGDSASLKYFEQEQDIFRSIASKYNLDLYETKDLKNNSILVKSK